MRASEFLTELFQPGKDWEWDFRGSEEAVAKFKVGDIPYWFVAYAGISSTTGKPSTIWEVEFKQNVPKASRTTKFGLTGTGNAATVLSTVTDIMRSFLEQYKGKVTTLIFSAEEDSRQALYVRMVKRLLPDWTMEKQGQSFILTAPEQLDEVGNTFYDVEKGNSYSPSLNLRAKAAKGVVHPMPKSDSFHFNTDAGTQYVIKLYPTKMKDGSKSVNVTFGKTATTYDDTYGITGEGDAVKVFSTVKTVLTKYLSEHPKITSIVFSAKENEPSRVKLYNTFVKQFKRWFPDFTNIDVATINGMVRFLVKKETA